MSYVKTISDYEKYYSIPDEEYFLIHPSDDFYKDIKKIVNSNEIFNNKSNLYCFYINYAGDKELIDVIFELDNYKYVNYFDTYKSVLKFTKHTMAGIKFLHEKKICHLDIKPENIVINTRNKTSKIIDFGFASLEPFDDFVKNPRGTPGYFPKKFTNDIVTEWLPLINANDMIPYNGKIPFVNDISLVYKIDSYCLGRVLYFLKHFFDINRELPCLCNPFAPPDNLFEPKLDQIIHLLLEYDVKKRINIIDCYNKFF